MFYLNHSPLHQRAPLTKQKFALERNTRRLIAIITISICLLLVLASTAHAQNSTHRVRVGETLGTIAAKYGTTVSTLSSTNGISNPNHIYVGQLLTIPSGSQSSSSNNYKAYVPASSGSPSRSSASSSAVSAPSTACRRSARSGEQVYYVRSGDTLSRIANRYGVSLSSLRSTNALWSDRINIGQCLIIPSGIRATPAPSRPQSRPVVNAVVTPVPLKISEAETSTTYNTP